MKRTKSKTSTFPTGKDWYGPLAKLTLFIFFCLTSLTSQLNAREILFEDSEIFDNLVENQIEEVMQSLEGNIRQEDIRALKNAKLTLINGNIKEAKFHLNRINESRSQLGSIKKRYQALIAFIENDYAQAANALRDLKNLRGGDSKQLCLLSLIALMGKNDKDALLAEESNCTRDQENFSPNELFWLNSMLNLFKKNKAALDRDLKYNAERILTNEEIAKLWLKINLYLNREKETLEVISKLPEGAYSSYKVRELIAFMYLRENNFERAMAFIEDVDSVNAENIKGNIRVFDKAYELAFGHFKLALQKKADSVNALEKGIPLSWILGQWKDGVDMLKNVSASQIADRRTKEALEAAFHIRLNNLTSARNQLTILRNDFQNQPPSEVLIMETFLALKETNKKEIEDSSEVSCKAFDGMSCYLAAQTINWHNLGLIMKEDAAIMEQETVNYEKLKAEPLPDASKNKIIEEVFIDQRDIEELDSTDAFKNGLGDI